MEDITVRQARQELDNWTRLRNEVDDNRDRVVRRALAAGVTRMEIHKRTGIARSTLERIADRLQAVGE